MNPGDDHSSLVVGHCWVEGPSVLESAYLHNVLIPAVPVPFDAQGKIDASAQERYARWMAQQPIEGVAVWAHTGRGLRLAETERAMVLECWRNSVPAPRLVIAAAGGSPGMADPGQVILSARSMARQALDLGADAVLVHPPTALRDRPDRDTLVLDYHATIAEVGLPLILFYLYEEAGGVRYGTETLSRLLERPEVVGIKVATLDSVITFEDLASLIEAVAPGKVLLPRQERSSQTGNHGTIPPYGRELPPGGTRKGEVDSDSLFRVFR
jgi:4-hydroxy-tetrahydrodipicolinate synthase